MHELALKLEMRNLPSNSSEDEDFVDKLKSEESEGDLDNVIMNSKRAHYVRK